MASFVYSDKCGAPCCTRRETLSAGGIGLLAAIGGGRATPARAAVVSPAPLESFALADVRLLPGPFRDAQQRSTAYLLSLDADRLLHGFRVNAGLSPKAALYGGWESDPTWADIHCQGHSLGHYLSGLAMMHAATGDPRLRARADYIVAELAACQQAGGTGLLSAFPEGPKLVAAYLAGEKVSGVPWYTLHKVYAGLRDAHQHCGNATALAVLVRFADWAIVATNGISDADFETMLGTEHGGMNELFADLFAITGDKRYRTMAERFSHKAILAPLAQGRDHLDGLHANTQIPKIVGFQRVFETGGPAEYHAAAAFFWRTVVETRSYATGGHGDGEHFYPVVDAGRHVFSPKTAETCGIYNMLKLTGMLFRHQPDAAYADFYERALFNGILGSQDPDSGMVTYFQGGQPGYAKLYCTPTDSFWCCTGTGMENHAGYGGAIYFRSDDALYVNQFIASELRWKARDAVLTQETRFPEAPTTRLRWSLRRPTRIVLQLRHPAWSPGAEVRVNGTVVARSSDPGSFVAIDREWRDGDTIDHALEMHVAAAPLPAAPNVFAFTYGPLVLAGAFGGEGIAKGADLVVNERKYGEYLSPPVAVPKLRGTPAALARSVRATGQPLRFVVADAAGGTVHLKPYHQIAHEHYATYWQV